MREAHATEAGRDRFRRFDDWGPVPGPPEVAVRSGAAPGPHGPVSVRVYEPSPAGGIGRPCLIWLHGGGFIGGDLDMREADWTAREICARAGAVVVSVDYRLAVDGVHYPVPHDDAVAAIAWVRDGAGELGIDPRSHPRSVARARAATSPPVPTLSTLRDRDDWAACRAGAGLPARCTR